MPVEENRKLRPVRGNSPVCVAVRILITSRPAPRSRSNDRKIRSFPMRLLKMHSFDGACAHSKLMIPFSCRTR